MHDPYVFIQAIESYTSEDSIIALPDVHEGRFVELLGRYYLFPRRLIRMSPGEPTPAHATHVVSSEAVEIEGASRVTYVSGNFALYKLPAR